MKTRIIVDLDDQVGEYELGVYRNEIERVLFEMLGFDYSMRNDSTVFDLEVFGEFPPCYYEQIHRQIVVALAELDMLGGMVYMSATGDMLTIRKVDEFAFGDCPEVDKNELSVLAVEATKEFEDESDES